MQTATLPRTYYKVLTVRILAGHSETDEKLNETLVRTGAVPITVVPDGFYEVHYLRQEMHR